MRRLAQCSLLLLVAWGCGKGDEPPGQKRSPDPVPEASENRDRLIALAKRIRRARDTGNDCSALIAEFQERVPMPNVGELFDTDYSAEHIVDYALGWKKDWPQMSKEELLRLVRKICEAQGSDAEIDLMVQTFRANCKHPAQSDLIFYPDAHFGGNSSPTPEQIVEQAMSAK